MKRYLLTLIAIISFSAAFAQPCTLTNLQINVYTASDGKCYADVTFDMDRNNGNKFIYFHIWNTEQYAKVNKDRWKKGSGPSNNDINGQGNGTNGHPALATVSINNMDYFNPVFSSYGYRPDPTVTSKTGTSVTTSSTPVSGSGPHALYRYKVTKVQLGDGTVQGGCSSANVCGIVWSTQANSTNSHIHCSFIGCTGAASNPLTLSGSADCATRKYTLTITNNTTTSKQATFDIYADNSGGAGGNPNGIFDPNTDTNIDSGYFSVSGNATFTINRPIPSQYLNFDLWAQVMFADGTTQMAKLSTTTCGPLPVTLAALNAARSGQMVAVKWLTSSEQSMKGFAVERSIGSGWEEIAFMNSKSTGGNSSSTLSYEISDRNSFTGISQYRLRIVDIDGRFRFSEIKTVKGEFQKGGLTVYPNPGIDGKVNVLFEESNIKRDIIVVDMAGRSVKQLKSVTSAKVVIDNLKPGMHVLKVTNLATGEIETSKIMIAD